MRREARALRAERLLHDLNEDLLPFFQQVLDLRRRAIVSRLRSRRRGACGRIAFGARAGSIAPATLDAAVGRRFRGGFRTRLFLLVDAKRCLAGAPADFHGRGAGIVLVLSGEAFEFLDGVDDLRNVQERVALEPDIDERRLHPRQDLRDASLVDVADDPALILALDEDLDDLVVRENGHARVVARRGDDHLLVHANDSSMRGHPTIARRTRAPCQAGTIVRPTTTRRAPARRTSSVRLSHFPDAGLGVRGPESGWPKTSRLPRPATRAPPQFVKR